MKRSKWIAYWQSLGFTLVGDISLFQNVEKTRLQEGNVCLGSGFQFVLLFTVLSVLKLNAMMGRQW